MKHLFTILFLLSFSCLFAVFSPTIVNLSDPVDCVTMQLFNDQKIEVIIIRKDETFTYYLLCDDKSKIERVVKNTSVKAIIEDPTKSEIEELFACEKLLLSNGDSINVEVTKVDTEHIYFHICGQSDFPERKLKLSFIISRTPILVGPSTNLDPNKANKKSKKASSPGLKNAGLWAFLGGLLIPPPISLYSSNNLLGYIRNVLVAGLILSLCFLLTTSSRRLKVAIFLITMLGTIIGSVLLPLILSILFT